MFVRSWRELALAALDQPFDLVIVGGGITGCGILLDATQRGLRCLLVERHDLACGTSSRSSKLVHGGFRYLKNLQFHTTWVSCRERDLQLRRFPHLVQPLDFLFPIERGDRPPGWMVDFGLSMYDAMAVGGRRHRRLSPEEIAARAPDVDTSGLDRALLYLDARVDDARLTWSVAATAAAWGGLVLARAEPEQLLRDAGGALRGVVLRDRQSGATHEVATRLLINAAGVWADELRARLELGPRRLRPSRGSHLVFSRERLPLDTAMTFLSPDDRRPIFVIPHPEGTLVGTTDIFHDGSLDDPRPTLDEVRYLLRAVAKALPGRPPRADDIVGAFAGIRPVIDDGSAHPSSASRDEALWLERGVLTISGGKLTTWREMAEQVVDRAVGLLAETLGRRLEPCRTRSAVLVGQPPPGLAHRLAAMVATPAVAAGLERRLAGLSLFAIDGASPDELRPLVDGADLCTAEARFHLRHAAVLSLGDLLLRRARFGLWQPAAARELAKALHGLCRQELGWNAGRALAEQDAFLAELEGWSFDPHRLADDAGVQSSAEGGRGVAK
jgi:glycerol-3-phosphate dehydrogenase